MWKTTSVGYDVTSEIKPELPLRALPTFLESKRCSGKSEDPNWREKTGVSVSLSVVRTWSGTFHSFCFYFEVSHFDSIEYQIYIYLTIPLDLVSLVSVKWGSLGHCTLLS